MHRLLLTLFVGLLLHDRLCAQTDSVLLQDVAGNTISAFSTIQAAYNAIPAPLTQPYVILLKKYTGKAPGEHFPIRFTEKAGASAAHTITLKQDQSNAFVQIHSKSDTSETIVFDGAKWVIIDGERPDPEFPCGIYLMATTANSSVRASFPCIRFVNGAMHNTVRYAECFNGFRAKKLGNEAHILFDTSSAVSGNAYNVIEYCVFTSDYSIRSKGSVQYPNYRNVIRDNEFRETYVNAITIQEGTGAMEVNHNTITAEPASGEEIVLVNLQYTGDTTRIINNTFRLVNNNRSDSGLTAVRLKPVSAGMQGVYLIANNYITTVAAYISQRNDFFIASGEEGYSRQVYGIDLRADYPCNAIVAHNTIRLMPTSIVVTARQLNSSALRISGDNSSGHLQVINNILHNLRKSGSAGSRQVAIDVTDTSGVTLDYNVYAAGDTLAHVGRASFKDLGQYRAAYPLQDAHSNDSAVLFESIDAHYLSARMIANPAFSGIPVSSVPTDMTGNIRLQPYRGADEPTGVCANGNNAAIYGYGDVCPGSHAFLQYATNTYLAPILPAGGLVHQWQSRALAGPVFTDIPGAQSAELVIPQLAAQ